MGTRRSSAEIEADFADEILDRIENIVGACAGEEVDFDRDDDALAWDVFSNGDAVQMRFSFDKSDASIHALRVTSLKLGAKVSGKILRALGEVTSKYDLEFVVQTTVPDTFVRFMKNDLSFTEQDGVLRRLPH